jgi:hypothetical protein
MVKQAQFFSCNIITREQNERIRGIDVPISSFTDNICLFETFSLTLHINENTRQGRMTRQHRQARGARNADAGTPVGQHPGIIAPEFRPITRRRRRSESDPDFSLASPPSRRRRRMGTRAIGAQPKFIRELKTFKNR